MDKKLQFIKFVHYPDNFIKILMQFEIQRKSTHLEMKKLLSRCSRRYLRAGACCPTVTRRTIARGQRGSTKVRGD